MKRLDQNQSSYLLRSVFLTVRGQINYHSDSLKTESNLKSLLKIEDFSILDADLMFHYSVPALDPGFQYQLKFQVVDQNLVPITFYHNQLLNSEVSYSFSDPSAMPDTERYSFSILDITEMEFLHNTTISLHLDLDLYGVGLNCEKPPIFKGKWFHIAGGILGFGLVGIGVLEKSSFADAADTYKKSFASNGSFQEGKLLFEDVKKRLNSNRGFNISGLSILAIDGIVYWIRRDKYKKEKRLFDKFCTQN